MDTSHSDISISDLVKRNIPNLISYHNDIVMSNNFDDMRLMDHPVRLNAYTILICTRGEIQCCINMKEHHITAGQMLIYLSGDIIQTRSTHNVSGYAIMFSEDFLKRIHIDLRLRVQNYIGLMSTGPITLPADELNALRPYYTLFLKNIADNNTNVIISLTHALTYTTLSMLGKYHKPQYATRGNAASRAQQIFDRFMSLLHTYHNCERSIQFYADKMCLTPKYTASMIKRYSGKGALEWINDYVILEAKMMLYYTTMNIQEISNHLHFPTQSAFGKYFKQQVGIGPKQYRSDVLRDK